MQKNSGNAAVGVPEVPGKTKAVNCELVSLYWQIGRDILAGDDTSTEDDSQ